MSTIKVSVPCRIDIGGTWDMDPFSATYPYRNPSTITIALNLKTNVIVEPYKAGFLKIKNDSEIEEIPNNELIFEGKFGLINAIISNAEAHDKFISISRDYPARSGLGGSGSMCVALLSALYIPYYPYQSKTFKSFVINLSHDIESGMSFSFTGYQDQCAAMYGGVRAWRWGCRSFGNAELLGSQDKDALSSRLLVAFTGEYHNSNNVNEKQIKSFMSGSHRQEWLAINDNTIACINAFNSKNWDTISYLVSEENKIRIGIVPERLSVNAGRLFQLTKKIGNGFGISGAGDGGCVFYLASDPDKRQEVKILWENEVTKMGGYLLDSTINFEGLKIE